MFAIITNLNTHEDAPRLSAYDPYFPTAFGNVSCDLNIGEQVFSFSACTADRCADTFFLSGKHYTHREINYRDLSDFCRLLFKSQNGQTVELPAQLAALCSN